MPKNKTVVYVVDFKNKQVVLREEVSNTNSKKDVEKMNMISSAVSSLVSDQRRKVS